MLIILNSTKQFVSKDSGILSNHTEFQDSSIYHIVYDQQPGPAYCYENNFVDHHGTHVSGIAIGKTVGSANKFTVFDYQICYYTRFQCRNNINEIDCYGSDLLKSFNLIKLRLKNNKNLRIVINMSFSAPIGSFKWLLEQELKELYSLNAIIVVNVCLSKFICIISIMLIKIVGCLIYFMCN